MSFYLISKEYYEKLQNSNKNLLLEKQKLEDEINKLKESKESTERSICNKRKGYFHYQKTKRNCLNNEIRSYLTDLEEKLDVFDLKLSCIEIIKKNGNEKKNHFLNINEFEFVTNKTGNELKALQVKERHDISDFLYHKIRTELGLEELLPNINRIKELRFEINKKFSIFNNNFGYYCNLIQKFQIVLQRVLTTKRDLELRNFDIKYSIDGTNVGRHVKLLNFTFTCLNEERCMGISGNYTIGVFKIKKECYEELACVKEIFDQIDSLNEIEIGSKIYTINSFFCSDHNMTSYIIGVNGANSNFSCIFCKCEKSEFGKINKHWSIRDTSHGARTIEEAKTMHSYKTIKERKGYSHYPLLKGIEIEKVVTDPLHLLMRITGALIKRTVKELNILDANIENSDLSKQPYLKLLVDYMETKCKIPNSCLFDKKIKIRELTGDECHSFFYELNLYSLFVKKLQSHYQDEKTYINQKEQIKKTNEREIKTRKLLDKFYNINRTFNVFYDVYKEAYANSISAFNLELRAKSWLLLYQTCFFKDTITPYMHVFSHHLFEFVQIHGNIRRFTLQGLEKLNDKTTQQYFKATDKKMYEKQILEKRNRIEYLETIFLS